MTLKEYQLLTSRTNTDLGSKAINAAHVTLGIVGEWNEASNEFIKYTFGKDATKESVTYEKSDCAWYISELANLFDIKLVATTMTDKYEQAKSVENVFEIAETIKKFLAYNKTVDIDVLTNRLNNLISRIKTDIESIIDGYTFEEALDMNIAKLQKRFPEKFSAELALAKGDEQ